MNANVSFEDLGYDPIVGDAAPARFTFDCPRRPGHRCGGLIITGAASGVQRGKGVPTWDWNGDRAAPTFSPSINCMTEYKGQPAAGCGWHGYIVAGEICKTDRTPE